MKVLLTAVLRPPPRRGRCRRRGEVIIIFCPTTITRAAAAVSNDHNAMTHRYHRHYILLPPRRTYASFMRVGVGVRVCGRVRKGVGRNFYFGGRGVKIVARVLEILVYFFDF